MLLYICMLLYILLISINLLYFPYISTCLYYTVHVTIVYNFCFHINFIYVKLSILSGLGIKFQKKELENSISCKVDRGYVKVRFNKRAAASCIKLLITIL
jgi:hypothetical protein